MVVGDFVLCHGLDAGGTDVPWVSDAMAAATDELGGAGGANSGALPRR